MKKRQNKIAINVDGVLVLPESVVCLHQKQPFPGGHVYQLTVSGGKLKKVFPTIKPGTYTEPEWQMCQSVFWGVEGLLKELYYDQDDDNATVNFFLNSIQQFKLSEQEARITGICSPRIRPSEDPHT